MTTAGLPEAVLHIREDSWETRSIQLVASCLKLSFAASPAVCACLSWESAAKTSLFSLVVENDSPTISMPEFPLAERKRLTMTSQRISF